MSAIKRKYDEPDELNNIIKEPLEKYYGIRLDELTSIEILENAKNTINNSIKIYKIGLDTPKMVLDKSYHICICILYGILYSIEFYNNNKLNNYISYEIDEFNKLIKKNHPARIVWYITKNDYINSLEYYTNGNRDNYLEPDYYIPAYASWNIEGILDRVIFYTDGKKNIHKDICNDKCIRGISKVNSFNSKNLIIKINNFENFIDFPSYIEWYESGNVKIIIRFSNDIIGHPTLPSIMKWHNNNFNNIKLIEYYLNDKKHRMEFINNVHLPAQIEYNEDADITLECYWVNGVNKKIKKV